MKTKGIRILDKLNGVICVALSDILREIQNGHLLHWSILSLEASGHLGEGRSIPDFEEQIDESKNGLPIKWDDINTLATKFYQIINIIVIGCKDENLLHRYEDAQEMYETCDVVIEMFDSSYWEVFAKDEDLINKLAKKFRGITFLESDFQKYFYK